MKTFVVVVVLFLTAEWLVVAFGPYPPARRKWMVQNLPVVSQVREWQQDRRVKRAFEKDEDGIIRFRYKGVIQEWHSPEDLMAGVESGAPGAYSVLNSINRPDQYWERMEMLKRAAHRNDLSAMGEYYQASIMLLSVEDSVAAANMLKNHPSATAEWALRARNADREWWTSREGQLLVALVARENVRHPMMTEEHYNQVTEGNKRFLADLRQRAEDGDADAEWIVDRLQTTPIWQPTLSE